MLEQSDGTGWMGFYALSMAAIASILNRRGRPGDRPRAEVPRAFRADLRRARVAGPVGRGRTASSTTSCASPDGRSCRSRCARSSASCRCSGSRRSTRTSSTSAETVNKRAAQTCSGVGASGSGRPGRPPPAARRRRRRAASCGCSQRVFDESEFLSPYGLRAVSRWHAEHPFELDVDGTVARIDYEPAESTTGMFGGNSNWRGPIWMPVNFLVVEALGRYARFFGDDLKVEYPTGSGKELTLERDRRRPAGAADLDLPRRRGRAAAVLRLGRAAPGRPGLEGQHALQRVLPRRQRRRARREPPDRLDGARRRADPPRPRRPRCRRSAS